MYVHTHRESLNPRHAGRCDCGHPVEPKPPARPRNLEFEREITEIAAKGHVDPTALIEFSEVRARKLSGEYVSDPMTIQPGRDRRRDAREEASDARNHLVWWLEENPGHEDSQRAFEALRLFVIAYDLLLEPIE